LLRWYNSYFKLSGLHGWCYLQGCVSGYYTLSAAPIGNLFVLSTYFFHFIINLNRIQSPCTRRQHVPPKHWNKLINQHGVISQNSVILRHSSLLSVFTQPSHSLRVDQMGFNHSFPSTLASLGRLWTPASLLSSGCRTHSSHGMQKPSSAFNSKL